MRVSSLVILGHSGDAGLRACFLTRLLFTQANGVQFWILRVLWRAQVAIVVVPQLNRAQIPAISRSCVILHDHVIARAAGLAGLRGSLRDVLRRDIDIQYVLLIGWSGSLRVMPVHLIWRYERWRARLVECVRWELAGEHALHLLRIDRILAHPKALPQQLRRSRHR